MQKNISSFFDTKRTSGIIAATVLSFVAVALITYGATTIGTNINTGGTLDVTGASTLAALTATNLTATASSTFNTTLTVTGASTFTGAASFNGNVTAGDANGDTFTVRGTASSFTSTATSTVAITTGLNFDSNTFVISPGNNLVGIGTSSPNIAGIIHGTCTVVGVAITASTTGGIPCASAEGITTDYKVFVQATSSFPGGINFKIIGASSTALNTIGVAIVNTAVVGGTNPGNFTLNFYGIK